MRSLIGLKNMIMFSAVLLSIGSVSAQQAFAGVACTSVQNGDWDDSNTWDMGCIGPFPSSSDFVIINHDVIVTGDEQASRMNVGGSLFIQCDKSLTVDGGQLNGDLTNHGTFTSSPGSFDLFSTFSNSGDYSGLIVGEGGSIVEISSICDRPIGGTVGSMDTVSLLVAGAQANMGLMSLALVGIVGAAAAVTYKLKSNKTDE